MLLSGGLVSYPVVQYLQRMRALGRVARQAIEVANPEQMERFQRIAADSARVDFIAKLIYTIRFRGREIPMVDGKRGRVVADGRSLTYNLERHLFTFAAAGDVEWFAAQEDVFKPAHSGAEGVIYYVDAGKV